MWPPAAWAAISSGAETGVLAIAVFLLGASVGVTEIIGRYRDEPWVAVSLPVARAYILGNGCISLLALVVIRSFHMFNEANAAVIALTANSRPIDGRPHTRPFTASKPSQICNTLRSYARQTCTAIKTYRLARWRPSDLRSRRLHRMSKP
jgi:hypothetical protein